MHVLSAQNYASPSEVAGFNQSQAFGITTLPNSRNTMVKGARALRLFRQSLLSFNPQLVMATGSRASWLAALVLSSKPIPWVVVGHGSEFGARTGLSTHLTRWAANQADGVICVSAYTQQAMHNLGINPEREFIIHNGADHQAFYPMPDSEIRGFRQRAGVEDGFILLTVGRVSDRKGQEVVIRALPRVLQENPNLTYWMAGLPENQRKLEAVAAHLGVLNAIRFWGRVDLDQLRLLYNACDLFVMTSRQLSDGDFEGYGIAALEAALCGKPALVSDNSGLAEAVKHNTTGMIVPQNDPAATADAILALVKSPDTLKRFGMQAQQFAQENQTWDQVSARYREVLQQVYLEARTGRK